MLLHGKKIAILGGGPGGLTLARLLQEQGGDVTVYERDADRHGRQQGATLDLHDDSGLLALRAAGLLPAFQATYRPGAEKIRLVDAQAHVVFDEHLRPGSGTFGDAHYRPEIDRGPLRDLLLDSLLPGTVAWDRQVVAVESAGAGWRLTFKNGATATADVLIGADGANSTVRPLVTPLRPFFTGLTVVEGNIYDGARNAPMLNELVKGGKIFAFGGGKTIILSAKGDGSLSFYTGHRSPADWATRSGLDFRDYQQVGAWFRQEFADWSRTWDELFATDQAYFVPRPQYCMPLDQTWPAHPTCTLLGDAAHLMPPYAGEGVNMALLDALELSQCLTSPTFPNLQAAIAHYETAMRTRASATAHTTLEYMDILHSDQGLNFMERLFAAQSPA